MPLHVPLRAALAAGKTAFGLWSTIPSTAVARTIAATPGISWVLIDGEHGLLNDTHLYDLTTAVATTHPTLPSPLVRVPDGSAWHIKRALDAGAHGVLVPLVRDAAGARAAVRAAKYPPTGFRGFGPMYTHHAFVGAGAAEYKAEADAQLLVLVQIELQDAVESVDAIAQVEGLDVLFIGPFDLALSLGVPFGGDEHERAIAAVLAAAQRHGKVAAIYCTSGAQARARAAQGFRMISVATDVDVISQGFAAHIAVATGAEGDAPPAAYSAS